ncbi:hypothetical protein Pelo_12000 [Pelomyxa schiedti]|nr:hypothetical protein Pelo_12000 [Pelomyxa schiedti]
MKQHYSFEKISSEIDPLMSDSNTHAPCDDQEEESTALGIIRIFSEESYAQAHSVCARILGITGHCEDTTSRLGPLACVVIRFIFPTHPEMFHGAATDGGHVLLPWFFDRSLAWARSYPAESHSFVRRVLLKVCNCGEESESGGTVECDEGDSKTESEPESEPGTGNKESFPDAMISCAHFLYGFMHQTGIGVPTDFNVALHHFRNSTTPPISRLAQYCIARDYFTGEGVYRDLRAAMDILWPLAERGSPMAWRSLGLIYQSGRLGAKDLAKSFECHFTSAKKWGWASAQNDVGIAYKRGWTGPPDHRQALAWFYLAAEQGLDTGHYNIGLYRETGTKDGTVQRDLRESVRWMRLADSQGYQPATSRVHSAQHPSRRHQARAYL